MIRSLLPPSTAAADPSQESWQETIIVGGGMSGLGCAHRLQEQSRPFLMISPEIGGRVRTSPDGSVNYGAYYVTSDYKATLPLVDLVDRVRTTDGWFHTDDRRYRIASWRLARHFPAYLRFTNDLRRFRRHFNRMNELADSYSRRELIAADPVLQQAFDQPAAEYIRQRRLEGLFAEYIDHMLWASFFCDPYQVSTLMMLAASLPLIVPMYSFQFKTDVAIEGFRDRVLRDTVQRIDLVDGRPRVVTGAGRAYCCENLVLATPMDRTNALLPSLAQPLRQGIDVSFYHVRGVLRERYRGPSRNFFTSDEAAVLSREKDGSFLYFYATDRIDKFFESYQVITHDTWSPALFFLGSEFVDPHPAPHVFIASDHDMPSMENAYLNGRYTANLLLRSQTDPPTAARNASWAASSQTLDSRH